MSGVLVRQPAAKVGAIGERGINFATKGSELKDFGLSPTRGSIPFPPDKVRPPEEPTIVAVIERCLCRVTVGADCYEVTGISGAQRAVRYGATLADWEKACGELLDEAMKSGMV